MAEQQKTNSSDLIPWGESNLIRSSEIKDCIYSKFAKHLEIEAGMSFASYFISKKDSVDLDNDELQNLINMASGKDADSATLANALIKKLNFQSFTRLCALIKYNNLIIHPPKSVWEMYRIPDTTYGLTRCIAFYLTKEQSNDS